MYKKKNRITKVYMYARITVSPKTKMKTESYLSEAISSYHDQFIHDLIPPVNKLLSVLSAKEFVQLYSQEILLYSKLKIELSL